MKKLKGKMIIALTILIFIITGCGGNLESGNSENRDNPVQGREDESWQAHYFRLEKQYELAVVVDNIYGCYFKDDKVLIDSIHKEDFSVEDSFVLPDASSILGMVVDTEGNIYLLGAQGESTGFWEIDTDGNLQDFAKLELENTEEADNILLKGIYADKSGNLYIWCEMMVPKT